MNNSPETVVFAVQSAVVELLELADKVTRSEDAAKSEELQNEVQKTVLMFIAAIVLSKREYTPDQQSFLSLLVDCKDMPGGEVRYLNEYAVRWAEASRRVPGFFDAAANFDRSNGTEYCRAMLRQIQLIGNNACASDGTYGPTGRAVVQNYLILLEEFVERFALRTQSLQVAEVPPVIESFQANHRSERLPPQDRFVTANVYSPKRKGELRWIPPNEPINIGNYQIPSGMIYVSDGQPSIAEASSINTQLRIGEAAFGARSPVGYWPQYVALVPDQRAAYLAWLAADRKDQNPELRELGYVFLFFYGLERRLLLEKGQEQEVVAEVVRLLHHYGAYTRSRSLQSYASQLIHFWGWQQGVEYYLELLEWMKTLPVSLLGDDELGIMLASQFQTGKTLQSEMAFELASRNIESRRSVVVSRVAKEFRELFSKRYLEQFAGGMALSRAKRAARLRYRPASPTLLQCAAEAFAIEIPDILGLSSQFKPLAKIWNSCIDDLSVYSRTRAKADDLSASLRAHLALPEELRAVSTHPMAASWQELLTHARAGKECSILEVGNVANLLNISQREKLTVGQSRDLVQAVESLGFIIEPDARFDGAYAWDQEIAVFKPPIGNISIPSQNYRGASVLLKLCVLVAGADGHVAPEELDVSRHFVEKNLTLGPDDKRRLEALEQILIVDPLRVKGSLARIASAVPKEQRDLICEVLVYVASADNVVTKDEFRALERIFKAFGLPSEKLDGYLKAINTEFREVVIQGGGARTNGEQIPAPVQPFRINMTRVDQIAQETSEVISILSKVMVDDGAETEAKSNAQTTVIVNKVVVGPTPGPESGATFPDWIQSLESKYHPVLLRLIEQDSWSKTEFDTLVKTYQLMPLNAFDAINEWADENLGDFLLEGDDPILVHKDSIP